ncbi:MAG TPA: hypothetical protein VGB42_04475 [Candidatus Thermoplasmatota archaeon]
MTARRQGQGSPRVTLLWTALVAAAAALAFAPSAAAASESEPNNDPSEASVALLNETAVGQVQSPNDDWWALNLTGAGLLTVDIMTTGGSAYVAFEDGAGAPVPSGLEDFGSTHDAYRLVVGGSETLYIAVATNNPNTAYTLSFAVNPDLSLVEGTSEVEPNHGRGNATDLPLEEVVSGFAPVEYADVDWWAFTVAGPGWLWVEVDDLAEMSLFVYEGATELEDLAGLYSSYYFFEVETGGLVHLAVSADYGDGQYTLSVRYASNSSVFWAGRDEAEPNGLPADANEVTAGLMFRGTGDVVFDQDDFLVVYAQPRTLIEVNITFDYDPLALAWVTVVGAPEAGEWDSRGDTWYFVVRQVFAAAGDMVLNVSVGWTDATYAVNVTATPLAILDDGVATLQELDGVEDLGLRLHPKNDFGSEEGFDLRNGNGYMFGESACAELDAIGGLPRVSVQAGMRLTPEDDEELQVLVVSRTMEFAIPSGGAGCFRAMSESEEGLVGSAFSSYVLGTPVTGDAATVVAEIDASQRDQADGQLALWAVTSGTSEARARTWSASQETIDSARSILNTAGVRTTLSPNAGPGTGGGGAGGAGGFNALPYIVLAVIALVLIGVAVAVRRKGKAPATPPMGAPGAAGPGPYGGTAYSPYPGQYAGAAGQPYSQPPPPASSSPYGAQYATYDPNPYAPQAPATPAPAQEPAYSAAGTAPCPSCGQPVAYYAATCPSCGYALTWS